MKKESKKQMVERIYSQNAIDAGRGIDEMVITEALAAATEECETKEDYFRALSALNLLNAAIKDRRWKDQLSYGFIKGMAARLLEQWIEAPVSGARAYYDAVEGAVFFDVDGVIFSYHRIPLSPEIRTFTASAANRRIEWKGVRLQRIPVRVFDLALAS